MLALAIHELFSYMEASPIQFQSLDLLLWGLVATIQFYSLPVMALSIAGIGVALVASGDDIDRKARLRHWIFNILIGGLLVFGSTALANTLRTFLGGN